MTIEGAIEWMQEEKASFERAPDLNGCPMTEYWQKAIDVYDMAISALRKQDHFREVTKKVEPMTLEELRKMDETVWVCYPQPTFGTNLLTEHMDCTRYKFRFADYGKTWLAYRQKPEEGTV